MQKSILLFFFIFIFLFIPHPNQAQNTKVMVRAKAKDAKFIGSSMGGAHILIKDASTNEILAKGITKGGTGDTDRIMIKPHKRKDHLSDSKSAGFLAELDINEPTFVTVEAQGPLNAKQGQVLSSTQLWVIPGEDITGDGVTLEVPGFIVDILTPQRQESLKSNSLKITANIEMMCGCPITDGGLWDAGDYKASALITSDDKEKQEVKLNITEKTNTFSGKVDLDPGHYSLTLYIIDPQTGNTGVDKTNFSIH